MIGVIGSLELDPAADDDVADIRFILKSPHASGGVFIVIGESAVGDDGGNGSLWMIASHFSFSSSFRNRCALYRDFIVSHLQKA